METTERIVEAYVRYVKGWATIPNIKCKGQFEIDLLAIDPVSLDRYHIESGVSVSGTFSALTAKPFSTEDLKIRGQQASQRRTLGYFAERKFGHPSVTRKLSEYGFRSGAYVRVIVSWGWTDEAAQQAKAQGIMLWDFREVMLEIAEVFRSTKIYFTDDTLRTLNLFVHATAPEAAQPHVRVKHKRRAISTSGKDRYWVYENWTHDYARIHRAQCSFCNDGVGIHSKSSNDNGRWHGPFEQLDEALLRARDTGRQIVKECGVCAQRS